MTTEDSFQKFTEQPSLERVPAAILFLIQKVEQLEKLLSGKPSQPTKYIDSEEGRKVLKMSMARFYKGTSSGEWPTYRGANGKGRLMFIREDLEAWQESQTKKKVSLSDISHAEKAAYNIEQEALANRILKGGSNG